MESVKKARKNQAAAWKNQAAAGLASVGDTDRKGVWEGDVVCHLGAGDGHAQHVCSQKHGEQRPPHVGKQFR